MKRLIVTFAVMTMAVSTAMAQPFTTASQANKLKPLGSLITGPTNLGIEGKVVNQLTGSVSLVVPLLPGIDLSYSSTNVPLLMDYENRDMQASDVGAGWNLELGSIVANSNDTSNKVMIESVLRQRYQPNGAFRTAGRAALTVTGGGTRISTNSSNRSLTLKVGAVPRILACVCGCRVTARL